MTKATLFSLLALVGNASAFSTAGGRSFATSLKVSNTIDELEEIGTASNPALNYYDPLGLAEYDFWGMGNAETIGFLRQSEIKHGRVAMAAFVGYIVHSNFHFPWPMTLDGTPFPSTDLSPEAQWDAIPDAAKYQIILGVGFLEIWDEIGGCAVTGSPEDTRLPHYTKGRLPGQYPTFDNFRKHVHPLPFDLYDPFRFSRNKSEADKAKGRIMEINNGRLAMIGIMGFLAADNVKGSVPLLDAVAQAYDGNVMIPIK